MRCIIDDCKRDRKIKSTGLCSAHHHKFIRYGDPLISKGRPIGEISDWLDKVWSIGTDECQIYPFPASDGYPAISVNGKTVKAHQYACGLANGPRPRGLVAAHECGKSKCVNPNHLSWKTQKGNIHDKYLHGTMLMGESHWNAKLTEEKVREIRGLRGKISRSKLAQMYGIGRSTLDNVIDNVTWREC